MLNVYRERLDNVRVKSDIDITVKQKIFHLSAIFLLGVVLGFLAKYLDNAPVVGDIGSSLGFWVFTATLLILKNKLMKLSMELFKIMS